MSQPAEKTELESADVKRMMELLPHRAPMLMVERLIDIVPGVSATGIKCVSINEPYFAGHFPGHPVMPGVLIVEAMAQTAGALVVHSLGAANKEKIVYFMTIDKARFRHPVVPGDQLVIPVKVQRSRGPVWRFTGEAYVNGKLCAEAEYSAMIVQPNAKPEAVAE
jgi:3-hydroxyacyl-[acyl-carrier-protein] dehydratase